MKCQVIIPMTGKGSRFKAVGYKNLKPFIEVCGKPMLEWAVSMYPEDYEFVFICRYSSMSQNELVVLHNIANTRSSVIVYIDEQNWKKQGPVKDVLEASDSISNSLPSFINYCDFFCLWDCDNFVKKAYERDIAGAIPCYTGFHPNLIPTKNVYASCLKDMNDNLIEIREKHSFDKDKTKAHHSPGIYYFKDGRTLKKYCQKLVDEGPALNGEFYASFVYSKMLEDDLEIWVPDNIKYFCQWGTPEDLEEFNMWMKIMKGVEV